VTLVSGEGKLVVGQGPVRTGVTALFPRGKASADPVFAGSFALNGNGEMTGLAWVKESGFLEGPVVLTNTHSVGVARDAVVAWQARRGGLAQPWSLPVVAETWDGWLNDIDGFHVKDSHVFAALDAARGGPVAEGGVGGGTGMVCFEFKGGVGTASRVLPAALGRHTVGVLVQANFGLRSQLLVAGVPVGREIREGTFRETEAGSIIIVVATDAPLLPHQLERIARRATLGLARTGSVSMNGSGDLFLAFSTANPGALGVGMATGEPVAGEISRLEFIQWQRMDPFFAAAVAATEEAVVNALVANETMYGRDGNRTPALPRDRLATLLAERGIKPSPL
jgi:L-aminopeptidase/D-esterase-like protein